MSAQQELALAVPSPARAPAPEPAAERKPGLHTCYLGPDAPARFFDCPESCVHAEDHAQTATCGGRWCEKGKCHVECWAPRVRP
jgi:hypothetical protein